MPHIHNIVSYCIIIIMEQNSGRPINDKYCILDNRLLGKGSTGNVYLGFHLQQQQLTYAIKSIDLKTINNEVTGYLLRCEVDALKALRKGYQQSKSVVKLVDIVMHETNLYIVMELLQGGTLKQFIKKHPQGLPQPQAMHLFKQIIDGYCQIASHKIIHRDIKPDNILFRQSPQISQQLAIIDFGYCTMQSVPHKPQGYYNVGSPKYMSPEAYQKTLYSQKSDIWALGVILYQLITGKTPDQGMTMQTYLDMIRKNGIPLPNQASRHTKQLLTLMLRFSHQMRISTQQLVKVLNTSTESDQTFLRKTMQEVKPMVRNKQPQNIAKSMVFNYPTHRPTRIVTPKVGFGQQRFMYRADNSRKVRKDLDPAVRNSLITIQSSSPSTIDQNQAILSFKRKQNSMSVPYIMQGQHIFDTPIALGAQTQRDVRHVQAKENKVWASVKMEQATPSKLFLKQDNHQVHYVVNGQRQIVERSHAVGMQVQPQQLWHQLKTVQMQAQQGSKNIQIQPQAQAVGHGQIIQPQLVQHQQIIHQQQQIIHQQPQIVPNQPQIIQNQPQIVQNQPQLIHQQAQIVHQQAQIVHQQPMLHLQPQNHNIAQLSMIQHPPNLQRNNIQPVYQSRPQLSTPVKQVPNTLLNIKINPFYGKNSRLITPAQMIGKTGTPKNIAIQDGRFFKTNQKPQFIAPQGSLMVVQHPFAHRNDQAVGLLFGAVEMRRTLNFAQTKLIRQGFGA